MKQLIKNSVSWIGKRDWNVRLMHSDLYATHNGTSYNSYVIEDDKTVLIDTVAAPFADEFISDLQAEGLLEKLDMVIVCHAEPDHSSALQKLMCLRPDLPIYCSGNGVGSIKGHNPGVEWDIRSVKNGERMSIGKNELVFINATMLHWPDTMFVYLTGDNILFSNDGFGQHLASEHLYDDEQDQDALFRESLKYFVNILTPFSSKITSKVEEIRGMDIPIDLICPSHGVIWRSSINKILDEYLCWASGSVNDLNCDPLDQITIIYDTMWESTRKMGESIADGIHESDPATTIKLLSTTKNAKSDILTEIFRSKGVLIGSPTVNNGPLPSIVSLIAEIKGLKITGKKFASFGSYGWSGEAASSISRTLQECGWEEVIKPVKVIWQPDNDAIDKCRSAGKAFALGLASGDSQ